MRVLRPTLLLTVLILLLSAVVAAPSGAGTATSERISNSSDVVQAAVQSSQAVFADGGAEYVVIGRSDVFADNLAGTSLAGDRGPMLFTTGGPGQPIRPETLGEVQRVVEPLNSRCTPADAEQVIHVYLLGSDDAVSAQVEQQLEEANYCVARLGGPSRFETAQLIAEEVRRRFGSPDVIIARADDWADAATGGAYAARNGIPVIVTQTDQLHPAAEGFLTTADGDIGTAIILGGNAAISQAVEDRVLDHRPVTRRVAGAARDLTAQAIAVELWGGLPSDRVTLVNGYADNGWAYAFAAAPHSARFGQPQIYTQRDRLIDSACTFLENRMPTGITVLGSESEIFIEVEEPAVTVASGDITCDQLQQDGPEGPPDGDASTRQLAIVVRPEDANATYPAGLYVASQTGQDARLLVGGDFTSTPSFFPSGDEIAVVENTRGDALGDDITVVNAETGATSTYYAAQEGFTIFNIAVSPDGSAIAFERAAVEEGNGPVGDPAVNLYLVSPTDLVPVSTGNSVFMSTNPWSADGRLTWADNGEVRYEEPDGSTGMLDFGTYPVWGPGGDIAWSGNDGAEVFVPGANGDPFAFDATATRVDDWFGDGTRVAVSEASFDDSEVRIHDLSAAGDTLQVTISGFGADVSPGGVVAVRESPGARAGLAFHDGDSGALQATLEIPAASYSYRSYLSANG